MNILNRLKLELNNQNYYKDEEYKQFLSENNLKWDEIYNKENNQRQLLLTVLDILETISNDIDLMRKITDNITGFSIGDAYKQLEKRIDNIKNKIATIPDPNKIEEDDNIHLLFYR